MLASPLMAGNDLQNMTPETKSILMNKEMIADQSGFTWQTGNLLQGQRRLPDLGQDTKE